MEKYMLKLQIPKDKTELAHQMRHVVDHFCDAIGDGAKEIPKAMLWRWMLSDQGPLKPLCCDLAKAMDEEPVDVGRACAMGLGVAAIGRELKEAKDLLKGEPVAPDWLRENSKQFSYLMVASVLKCEGLGCSCAFCTATWFGLSYMNNHDTHARDIIAQLNAIETDDEEKCAGTIVDKLAAEFDWEKPSFGELGGIWRIGRCV